MPTQNDFLTATGTCFESEVDLYKTVIVNVYEDGGGSTITYEVSPDGSTWNTCTVYDVRAGANLGANTSNFVGRFFIELGSNKFFRARVTTFVSGFVATYFQLSQQTKAQLLYVPGSGGGGSLTDGDKGEITVTAGVWEINSGVVDLDNLGGTITAAGKALLDDADAAAQRTTMGAAAASHTHTKADVTDFAHTHVKADVTDFAHTHPQSDVTGLTTALAGKSDTGHTHAQSDVTGLVTALAGKAPSSHTHIKSEITDFAHSHVIADVTGLQTALDGKQAAGSYAAASHTHVKADVTDFAHTHPQSEITNLVTDLAGKASSTHTHPQSDITNLVTDLAGKAATSHTHTASNITDFAEAVDDRVAALLVQGSNITLTYDDVANSLTIAASGGGVSDGDKGDIVVSSGGTVWSLDTSVVTAFAKTFLDDADAAAVRTTINAQEAGSYAAASHTHAQSEITNLVTDLAGKAASSHTHTASNISDSTAAGRSMLTAADAAAQTALLNAFTSALKGLVPASGGGTTNFLRADGTWAAPGGGSDPWTYVKLGSDFVTGNTTNDNVTGFNFTPAANKTYVIEGQFFLRTATATVGARPGVSFPTGLTDSVCYVMAPNSATSFAHQNFANTTTANAASTGLTNTTNSQQGQILATLIVGASPSGNFQITLASETAATNVTMKAGSWFRYREI